jgi:hypothetical protein
MRVTLLSKNLRRTLQFEIHFPDITIMPQAVAQLASFVGDAISIHNTFTTSIYKIYSS